MCVRTSVTFRVTCPETGMPVDGTYNDRTGRLDLIPDPPMDATVELRSECILWCIRTEAASYLTWSDARSRLISRGVNSTEL